MGQVDKSLSGAVWVQDLGFRILGGESARAGLCTAVNGLLPLM